MGILSNILNNIFPPSHPALVIHKPLAPHTHDKQLDAALLTAKTATSITPAATLQTHGIAEVDVEKMLDAKTQTAGQSLHWRSSIVDLLKVLELDNSLQSRNKLASELGYQGHAYSAASLNNWLHRQVMNKLAAHGGKVPAHLRD